MPYTTLEQSAEISTIPHIPFYDHDDLLRRTVLVADLRLATDHERAMGYYLEEPVIIPDPATIRPVSYEELVPLSVPADRTDALHICPASPELRQDLVWADYSGYWSAKERRSAPV